MPYNALLTANILTQYNISLLKKIVTEPLCLIYLIKFCYSTLDEATQTNSASWSYWNAVEMCYIKLKFYIEHSKMLEYS